MALERRTPLKRGGPLKRTAFNRHPSRSKAEFTPEVRAAVEQRCASRCEARMCGGRLYSQLHHIRRRSQGGDGSADNALAVCNACHEWIHSHPAAAAEKGWLVLRPDAE